MKHHRTCSLCEALCGLELEVHDGAVTKIRGNPDDVFSHGHVCPKGVAMADLHTDPDRIRQPMRRTASGWEAMGWDAALDLVADRLHAVRSEHGRHAVGIYLGNPNVHHFGNLLANQLLVPALRTHNKFSATSTDQLPQMFAALHMFGHQLLLPIADLDRTQHLLVLGANPYASNGSILSAGNIRDRLAGIRTRGGRIVVVDPRRTATAEAADAHHFIRPGTDPLLMLAMLHVIFAEDLVAQGPWRTWTHGLDTLRQVVADVPPERVASTVGLSAGAIRTLARDLAAAPTAAVYGRFGICTQRFGGLAAWLTYALNLVTGNVDKPGGVMFTTPAADLVGFATRVGQRGHFDAWRSRVRDLPEFGGELPTATLAEEIDTPGEGQIRALVTIAGNPVLSAPNGKRLEPALEGLDFMVSLDMYRNETTRHAHVILPASSPLERDAYGLAMHALAVRNVARFAPALFSPQDGARDDADTMMALAQRLHARAGNRRGALTAAAARKLGTRRMLDLLIRMGPHGRGLNPLGKGLTLADIARHPHGLDLGPLRPCLPDRLATPDRRVDLAPAILVADVPRLLAALDAGELGGDGLRLIGRRDLRSNNSWMHNSARLVKGKARCTLRMHPSDAAARGLAEGDLASLTSRVGSVDVPVECTDRIMPGVVSLPHGWGHHRPGTQLTVASERPGESVNDVTDEQAVDQLTGTAVLGAVPVEVGPAGVPA